MHEKDRKKVMAAGFTLYRCSYQELAIKRRSGSHSWKIESRCATKKAVKEIHLNLLDNPNVIQD